MLSSVGVRREDKNEWERRVPLTPDHVSDLVELRGQRVVIQPSKLRAFPDRDYRAAGAEIAEDLGSCNVILGIKEMPAETFVRGASYGFFSHTIKGQAANMPMLQRLIELGCTLIDYEKIVDAKGRRLVFFGRHAGYSGMIDALWALGRRLASEGFVTPFEQVRLAHDYTSLDEAAHHISRVGDDVRHAGLPRELQPMVFVFTGSGNVSLGAQEICDRLPIVAIDVDGLAKVAREPLPHSVIYKLFLPREQRFDRIGGGDFDAAGLKSHPENYRSALPRILPHVTMIVHGAFWEPGQPRLVTKSDIESLCAEPGRPRLAVIADISCDVDGGIEATVRTTTPGNPVYVWDVERKAAIDGVRGRGPVILAVDNLPCQLPRESSQHFGDTLLRFVPALTGCRWDLPLTDLALPEEVLRAIVVHRGQLAPAFASLAAHLGHP